MEIKTALISVYHKGGITQFADQLLEYGITIYASGGTHSHLVENDIDAIPVSKLVGGEPILNHRVVTLSREVHAGLLAKDTDEDIAELANLGIPRIDIVCVDMYPLEKEIAKPDSPNKRNFVIEQTDIGGLTLIRSAAKGGRIVICDPHDRVRVIDWLKNGSPDDGLREELAAKAEFIASKYCLSSTRYLSDGGYEGFLGKRIATCKYGENAYQTPAYLYSNDSNDRLSLDKFVVVSGDQPSYNNLIDIHRMLQTMTHITAAEHKNDDIKRNIAIGVKHGNACGAAIGLKDDEGITIQAMLSGDPLAIFGGLVMVNFNIDASIAELLHGKMLDGIVAPGFTDAAIKIIQRKSGKTRFIVNPALKDINENELDQSPLFRYVRGGFLMQPNYTFIPDFSDQKIIKYGAANPGYVVEMDLLLAWAIGSTSNSNTITIVKNGQLIGNGVGQQDRVGAADLAIARARRAGHDLSCSVAYSDSFFPFPDAPQRLIDAGVIAIFTSSGSIRDSATIDLCAENNIALYMVPDHIGRGFFGH